MAHIGGHRNDSEISYFSLLPDECIYLIFSYIPLPSLVLLSRTSKRFRRLCLDSKLWKNHLNTILRSLYPIHLTQNQRKPSMEGILKTTAPLQKDYEAIKIIQQELNQIRSINNVNIKHYKNNSSINIWNAVEDESTLVWGVRQPLQTKAVLYGSLDCLVKVLTCVEEIDLQFVKGFLMTFESFTSIELLFVKLMQRYFVPTQTQINYKTIEEWRKELVLPVRFRVINILKLLIEKVSE